jgi:hypothetical protein
MVILLKSNANHHIIILVDSTQQNRHEHENSMPDAAIKATSRQIRTRHRIIIALEILSMKFTIVRRRCMYQ